MIYLSTLGAYWNEYSTCAVIESSGDTKGASSCSNVLMEKDKNPYLLQIFEFLPPTTNFAPQCPPPKKKLVPPLIKSVIFP